MEVVAYAPRHLDEVMTLAAAEGWTTFASDRERAGRAMTAPGVTALVAVDRVGADGERVLGFAQALGDGLVGYLSLLVVDPEARGHGIGRALVREILAGRDIVRLDLLSTEGAESFYRRLPHQAHPGFRLQPW